MFWIKGGVLDWKNFDFGFLEGQFKVSQFI
jgi:hypothetical protein